MYLHNRYINSETMSTAICIFFISIDGPDYHLYVMESIDFELKRNRSHPT